MKSITKHSTPPRERSYWVVSPNVRNDREEAKVKAWCKASREAHVAFMGYAIDKEPNDKLSQGPKFAGSKTPGVLEDDIILIARRNHNEAQIVGFGVVTGPVLRGRIKGIRLPDTYSIAARELKPFVALDTAPHKIPLLQCLPKNRALFPLKPDIDRQHDCLCKWMAKHLSAPKPKPIPENVSDIILTKIVNQPKNNQLDYHTLTQAQRHTAKKTEARLLRKYELWLNEQGRDLPALRSGNLQCDGYEPLRKNLIEAKSSSKREYIRMAVGQLLDYAFHIRLEYGEPHKAILLPNRPDSRIVNWLNDLHISVIWPWRGSFFDNANGRFVESKKT